MSRELTVDEDPKTGEKLETPQIIGWMQEANPDVAKIVLDADTSGNNGRSCWYWLRLANGDLMLACFPQGDTYIATEADDNRP